MADIEIGANRRTLLDIAERIKRAFEDSSKGEHSLTISAGDHELSFGNEDMEREDIEDGEIYVDISGR